MTFHPLVEPSVIGLFVILLLTLVVWGAWRTAKITASRRGRAGVIVTWIRRFFIGLALAVALAGPAVPAEEIEVTSNIEIVFAVDRTGSMAAEDGPENAPRLDAVREDIQAVLEATAGSRYAVVTWDAQARVELPFTTDASAVQTFAQVLHQEISEFSAGSAAARPIFTLYDLLESAQEQRPENIRYLLVFTDGETTDDVGVDGDDAWSWQTLTPLIDGGAVLGYGTEEGGPMRIYLPGGGGIGDYMTDPSSPENPPNESGEPLAISRIDLEALRDMSGELDVELLVNPTVEESAALGEGLIEDASLIEDARGLRHTFRYLVWVPALVAGVLLIWEFAAGGAEMARLRRSGAI